MTCLLVTMMPSLGPDDPSRATAPHREAPAPAKARRRNVGEGSCRNWPPPAERGRRRSRCRRSRPPGRPARPPRRPACAVRRSSAPPALPRARNLGSCPPASSRKRAPKESARETTDATPFDVISRSGARELRSCAAHRLELQPALREIGRDYAHGDGIADADHAARRRLCSSMRSHTKS